MILTDETVCHRGKMKIANLYILVEKCAVTEKRRFIKMGGLRILIPQTSYYVVKKQKVLYLTLDNDVFFHPG